ncbi:hypothetical protein GGR56DRAFT_637757 [Xylariaceae sp. FL0804]|nr:hypothetical protein GGR56DRAFT_637757 [Xylariaceae sp. FL0804]
MAVGRSGQQVVSGLLACPRQSSQDLGPRFLGCMNDNKTECRLALLERPGTGSSPGNKSRDPLLLRPGSIRAARWIFTSVPQSRVSLKPPRIRGRGQQQQRHHWVYTTVYRVGICHTEYKKKDSAVRTPISNSGVYHHLNSFINPTQSYQLIRHLLTPATTYHNQPPTATMKFAATTLFAAATSAAAVARRQTGLSYAVTGFSAACIPHSTQCNYSFTAKASDIDQTSYCTVTAGSDGSLPAVFLQTCDNTGYTFSIVLDSDVNPDGINLVINTPNVAGAGKVQGVYDIFPADLETTSTGAGEVQSYIGVANFTVPADITLDV